MLVIQMKVLYFSGGVLVILLTAFIHGVLTYEEHAGADVGGDKKPQTTTTTITTTAQLCQNFSEDEFEALHVLYSSLSGENWIYQSDDSTPWNFTVASNNPCNQQWAFLNCTTNENNCSINSIAISAVPGVAGTLPEVFNKFSNLTYLAIEFNEDLVGSIPATLANVADLWYLSLMSNSMTGTVPIFLCKDYNLSYCDFIVICFR